MNSINSTFKKFIDNKVNLDPNLTKVARKSRDYLLSNINAITSHNDTFELCSDFNIYHGSFARNTKIRPLDDIDLMIGISGENYVYNYDGLNYKIIIKENGERNRCLDNNILNSRKVVEYFKSGLSLIPNYSCAEIHRNMQAITLQLKTYPWNFDIVPCFYTTEKFYLIPDGYGNWKKTDPRIDKDRVTKLNQKYNGRLLELIRLVKYLNSKHYFPKIPSYLLETIILNYYETNIFYYEDIWNLDEELVKIFNYIGRVIISSVEDYKKIQGNLNTLNVNDREKVALKFQEFSILGKNAIEEKNSGNEKSALKIWKNIFGEGFIID